MQRGIAAFAASTGCKPSGGQLVGPASGGTRLKNPGLALG